MDINVLLEEDFTKLDKSDISDDNNFLSFDVFKKFIYDHYELSYLETNNHLKSVKIKRLKIYLENKEKYINSINEINKIIKNLQKVT